VSGLPPALAPWAASLASLDPDLQLLVGEWARRLASALGPLGGLHVDAGEPDGISGLTRRAPYERLLLTEWLLATELPDEFLRRASAGEHLFLQRSRRERTTGRRVVALLDTGPEQLGSPRLAQLALLVVLSARASAAGAAFEWSTAQDIARSRAVGFSPDRVSDFLWARSTALVDDAQVASWIEDLTGDEGPPPECWLVGGAGLLSHARPGDSTILIEEEVDPTERRLRLVVSTRRKGRGELFLDLPGEADGKRLLRDPFSGTSASPSRLPGRVVPDAGVVFHPNGHRLLVRLEGGDLLDVWVSNSARASPGRPVRIEAPPGLVAFGWSRRANRRMIRWKEDGLWLDDCGFVTFPGSRGESPVRAPIEGRVPWLFQYGGRSGVFFQDSTGAFYRVTRIPGAPGGILTRIGDQVVAPVWHRRRHGYVERAPDGRVSLWPFPVGQSVPLDLGRGTGRAFTAALGKAFVVATEDRPGGPWSIRGATTLTTDPGSPTWLQPPGGTEVVGLARVVHTHAGDWPSSAPSERLTALVLLEADRRTFSLLDSGGFTTAHRSSVEVASASVSTDGRVLAYTTRQGGLVAWSLARGESLLQYLPEDPP
jgi:hypothetical protein